MTLVAHIKKYGWRATWRAIQSYQIDKYVIKFLNIFLKNKPLKDIIVIESHNDFDSNGVALYNYLLDNKYNKKYKIVWLIKHPEWVPDNLPENVEWVPEHKLNLKRIYYRWRARYFSYDQDCEKKQRDDQTTIYLSHGSFGLKDCTGLILLPDDLDYCLTASEYVAPIDARQYMWKYPDSRLRICGFPMHDEFYSESKGDLGKITKHCYEKVILWMPTFRKSETGRIDGIVNPLGIPLIRTHDEFEELDNYLSKKEMLLIIKIHPKQDISSLHVENTANINILTATDVKRHNIDNIKLEKDVDALISDYSSAAYDFLHVNKPIAYDLSDLEGYARGICVSDPRELMAGHEINKFADLLGFIDDISKGIDRYSEERKALFDKLFKYHDGNSCKRVVELLGLSIMEI